MQWQDVGRLIVRALALVGILLGGLQLGDVLPLVHEVDVLLEAEALSN